MDVNNLLSQSYSEQLERNDFPYWTLSGLFTSLKPKLIEMGYSEIDLKKITVYKEECALNINELSEMNKDKLQRQLDCEKLKAEMDKKFEKIVEEREMSKEILRKKKEKEDYLKQKIAENKKRYEERRVQNEC